MHCLSKLKRCAFFILFLLSFEFLFLLPLSSFVGFWFSVNEDIYFDFYLTTVWKYFIVNAICIRLRTHFLLRSFFLNV